MCVCVCVSVCVFIYIHQDKQPRFNKSPNEQTRTQLANPFEPPANRF